MTSGRRTTDYSALLYDALYAAYRDDTVDCVANSGGLDSAAVSCLLSGGELQGITVAHGDLAQDLEHSRVVAATTGMRLHVATPEPADLLLGASETVRILGCYSDTTIRNALVMYVAISKAKQMGITSLATGDGADELFAGYDFLVKSEPARLRAELVRIRGIMRFSSSLMGDRLGVKIVSPFLHPGVIEAASIMPPDVLVGVHDGVLMGKLVLRHAFAKHLPSSIVWRPKMPMQDGAGTIGIVSILDSLISDSAFAMRTRRIQEQNGIRIRTKESLYYYEQYVRHHGLPPMTDSGRVCPDCHCELVPNVKSCRMCGAFPV